MTLRELNDVLVWVGRGRYDDIPKVVSNIIEANQVYLPYKKVFDIFLEKPNFDEEKYRQYMDIRIPPGLSVLLLDALGMIAFYDRNTYCVKSHSSVHKIDQYSDEWAESFEKNGFSRLEELSNENEIAMKASGVYMRYGWMVLYKTYERTNASIEWETRFQFLDD